MTNRAMGALSAAAPEENTYGRMRTPLFRIRRQGQPPGCDAKS